jgi:membrane protease YdiL (CAAX protease family)
MTVGSKSLVEKIAEDEVGGAPARQPVPRLTAGRAWAETLWVFVLLELVMWTPHSLLHSTLIALLVLSPLWFTWRSGYTRTELGLTWPPRRVTAGICGAGLAIAFIFPVGAVLAGNPLPADPTWPKLSNILPYFVWAIFQQFLLQSFIFLRMESALGSKRAVIVSSAFFTFAHLPNWPLTALTLFGALFFTELFRRYRSIYPLGIAHFFMGISIAYSFPTSLMHHMRVGLSFWKI